jgi:hypothetical protein
MLMFDIYVSGAQDFKITPKEETCSPGRPGTCSYTVVQQVQHNMICESTSIFCTGCCQIHNSSLLPSCLRGCCHNHTQGMSTHACSILKI